MEAAVLKIPEACSGGRCGLQQSVSTLRQRISDREEKNFCLPRQILNPLPGQDGEGTDGRIMHCARQHRAEEIRDFP